jgi:putative transposase
LAIDPKKRGNKASEVALFRYKIVNEVEDDCLTKKQRGALVRHLAAQVHVGVDGQPQTVSRESIDRWARLYRAGGFDALRPCERNMAPRTDQALLEYAFALKKERPERTAAQVAEIIKTTHGDGPAERTLQTHFAKAGLNRPSKPATAFGRFEAEYANDRWTGDALHGPLVAGKKAILFAYEDDNSRLLAGYRWVRREDTIRAETALRVGLESRGIPKSIYLDNGSSFVDFQLKQTLALLNIRLTHSTPRRPQGHGKIERLFRTVRDQFLVEIDDNQIDSMDELNQLFTAWVETVYHHKVHTETQMTPMQRWDYSWANRAEQGLPGIKYATPAELAHAFLWTEQRLVSKTATISFQGNTYEVDSHLVGRKVDLRFDPFNLDDIDIYLTGVHQCKAKPFEIKAHVHPKARPDETTIPTPTPTGINYLELIKKNHEKKLSEPVRFADLFGNEVQFDKDGGII